MVLHKEWRQYPQPSVAASILGSEVIVPDSQEAVQARIKRHRPLLTERIWLKKPLFVSSEGRQGGIAGMHEAADDLPVPRFELPMEINQMARVSVGYYRR